MKTLTQQQQGIALLAGQGYDQGEYNPHNVRAWSVYSEHGEHGIVTGEHEQEALDNAVDEGLLDGLLMSPEDYAEYEANGWDDSYICLGSASEPFWSEHLGLQCIATTNENTTMGTV